MRNYRNDFKHPYYIQKIQDYVLPFTLRVDYVFLYILILLVEFTIFNFIINFELQFFDKTKVFAIHFFIIPFLIFLLKEKIDLKGKSFIKYISDFLVFYIYNLLKKNTMLNFKRVKSRKGGVFSCQKFLK